jgi:hypothetical protein
MNFMQALAYQRSAKLLLMLGLLVVLSLAFTTFGPDQVLADGKIGVGGGDLILQEWSYDVDIGLIMNRGDKDLALIGGNHLLPVAGRGHLAGGSF